MESTSSKTLVMNPIRFQSKSQETSENSNPNVTHSISKPALQSKKPKVNPINRIRERRFVVVKKNSTKEDCKCNENIKKCVCVAYETLRASQEDFFRRDSETVIGESSENVAVNVEEIGISTMKRRREQVMEEARMSLPEYGKVKHLVEAFEKLTCFPLTVCDNSNKNKKGLKWELPGMRKCEESETEEWSSSFSPNDLVLTAKNLGLEQPVSSSWENSVTNGGRRSRRNSLESSSASMGSRRLKKKKKQVKVTSPKPFKLRTEERGRMKEEEFTKKMQELMLGEEKMRIPIAQSLPCTTDEPESLAKPHVKDITMPVNLKLHSDIRAVERAEFDNQVAEKMSLIEQYKAEKERQQKLAEEEELRRLRKEMIPKAQPMPFFDRPFIPKRSKKHPTIPRDPKFSIPQHKKSRCCSTSSWSEAASYMTDLFYQQDL